MKRILLVIIIGVFEVFSICANENFRINYNNDNTKKLVYNHNNEAVYELNKESARINWKTIIIQNYLFYISITDDLMVIDLNTKENKLIIHDVGDFSVSDDLQYICIGRKTASLNGSRYTTVPELYDLKTYKFVLLNEIDFSFLKEEVGISTNIKFQETKNGFAIDYHWDTSISEFSLFISLDSYTLYRIK